MTKICNKTHCTTNDPESYEFCVDCWFTLPAGFRIEYAKILTRGTREDWEFYRKIAVMVIAIGGITNETLTDLIKTIQERIK